LWASGAPAHRHHRNEAVETSPPSTASVSHAPRACPRPPVAVR